MGNKNKELGKKHPLRRAFIVSSIITALSVVSLVLVTAFIPVPSMLLSAAALTVSMVSASIAIGVGINAAHAQIANKVDSRTSLKNMNKIIDNSTGKNITYTANQKVKIVKKMAKANLRLCKRMGSSTMGIYLSVSDFKSTKENEASNIVDNLELLQSVKKNNKKYSAKIAKKRSISGQNLRTNAQRWTKTYNDFIEGVSVVDRRTEIICSNVKASERFQELVKNQSSTNDLGGSVVVSVGNNDLKQAYARVADLDLLPKTREILVDDVYDTLKKMSGEELDNMFPVKIFTYSYDKSAKSSMAAQPLIFYSMSEVERATHSEIER